MAQFSVPPLPPPAAPLDDAPVEEVKLWSKRISTYLTQLYQHIEQNVDSYIGTSSQLGTDLIGTDQITDSAVTTAKIADSAVTAAKIEDSGVTSTELGPASVTTVKIEDSGVTTVKIENSAVTNTKFVALTTDQVTAHASVGASVLVSYAIARTSKPMVSPQVSAAGWLASLAYVTTSLIEITAFNNSGATSCTVYANYY